jgi:hypothetical protein
MEGVIIAFIALIIALSTIAVNLSGVNKTLKEIRDIFEGKQ